MNISKDSFKANEKEPEGKSDENTLTEKGERERGRERERERERKRKNQKRIRKKTQALPSRLELAKSLL